MTKKTRVRGKCQSVLDDIATRINQWRVIVPVYVTSLGLAVAYSWGWFATIGPWLGFALAAAACTAELLKPVMGEKVEDAAGLRRWVLCGITGLCTAFGALSCAVAFSAAHAPQAAYEAGQAAIVKAEQDLNFARARLSAFDCGPDMPASRCERNRAANADAITRATIDVDAAGAALAIAQGAAPARPEIAFSAIPLWVELFLGVGIDIVLIFTPWAARPRAVVVAIAAVAQPSPAHEAAPMPRAKPNTGGWDTRRERYGASGIKRRRGKKPDLVIVGGVG